MAIDDKWNAKDDTAGEGPDRGAYLEGLAGELGAASRDRLEQLPIEELRYLSWRWDLWPRYKDPRLGSWLLTWDTSVVERGRQALAEIEACANVDWTAARALDVGCNDGGFLIAMARRGAQAHGVDVEEHAIIGAYLRSRSWGLPIAASLASAGVLPYPDESFDAVTCGDVIEHLPDPAAALREIRRVLKPGGHLWLAAPTRYYLRHLWRDPHHFYFGVSVLPRKLAAWYLVRFRRALPTPERYGVERLPTYGGTTSILRRLGLEIVAGEYRPLAALRDPARVETPWKRRFVTALQTVRLHLPLSVLFGLAAELRHSVRLVCRKPG